MKRGLDWYKREPQAIRMAMMAARMTTEQAAVYSLVIDLIYEGGGETPNEPQHIAAHFSDMGSAKARRILASLIDMGKLFVIEGMLLSDAWLPDAGREAIPSAVRLEVLGRDGGRCAYCGSTTGPHELDHVYPASRGGRSDADNLTVACRPCNRSKGARTPEEWLHG